LARQENLTVRQLAQRLDDNDWTIPQRLVQCELPRSERAGHDSAEVEADLKRDIAAERPKTDVKRLREGIDDEIDGGARLAEIVRKLNLELRTIEAVNRSGRPPGGNPVADLPDATDLVDEAFIVAVGAANDALPRPAGGFVWYDVISITLPREAALTRSETGSRRASARMRLIRAR
jgi:hypothetical protein